MQMCELFSRALPAALMRLKDPTYLQVEEFLASEDWLAEDEDATFEDSLLNSLSHPLKDNSSVDVSFSMPPATETEERTSKEVEDLIAQMNQELTSPPKESEPMQARLDALQAFKSSRGSTSSAGRVTPEGPGDAPIYDPYEYELAASESDNSDTDSE